MQFTLDTYAGRIEVVEDCEYSSCGSRIWSCPLLAKYIERQRNKLLSKKRIFAQSEREHKQPFHVLELGAGLGLVSIAMAKILEHEIDIAKSLHDNGDERYAADVQIVATDLEIMLPLLRKNAAANVSSKTVSSGMLDVRQLAWSVDEKEIEKQLTDLNDRHFDLIVGADCVYQVEFVPALVETLRLAARGPSTTILICHEIRSKEAHDLFLETAPKYFVMTKISTKKFMEKQAPSEQKDANVLLYSLKLKR